MERSALQRLIPIVLVLVVVGLVIFALISIGRTFFGGGHSSPSPSATPKVNVGKQALTGTDSSDSVRMSVRGPLVADENYHTYTVTISPSLRDMTTYQGYANKTVEDDQLANSEAAYEQFVYALNRAKLMDGTPFSGDADDTRGICATGTLYQFDVLQGGTSIQDLWTTSCSGSPGSLKANLTQVSDLFEVQIPDFATRLQKINGNS